MINVDAMVSEQMGDDRNVAGFQFGGKSENRAKRSERRRIKKKVIKEVSRISPGEQNARIWEISGLPTDNTSPVYVRFRPYVKMINTRGQRITAGMWGAEVMVEAGVDADGNKMYNKRYHTLYRQPQPYLSGTFHELVFPANIVDETGTVRIRFANYDPFGEDVFFQPTDGPFVMLKVTGFAENYIRAVVVLCIWLAVITGLGCFGSSFMSLFPSLFFITAYFIIGPVALYILASVSKGIGLVLAYCLSVFFIPLNSFDVSGMIAEGRLVEHSFIFVDIFLLCFVLRALPLIFAGIFIYSRREIGKVVVQ